MTGVIRSVALAGGLLVLAGVQNASAQIAYPVEFTTAFPFTVGQASLPAGTYTIKSIDDDPAVLELRGQNVGVIFETNRISPNGSKPKTEVVFKRYGSTSILKDVWVRGSDAGFESVAAAGERHLAKTLSPAGEQRVIAQQK
jgi:hypothetical protein